MKSFLQLDWLAFTFKSPTALLDKVNSEVPSQLEVFKKVFPELNSIWEYMEIRGSKNHYSQSIAFGTDFMCFFNENNELSGNNQNMGVNFEIPSHSLKLFFDLMHVDITLPNAVSTMMKLLLDRGCRCSRIDLAFDDYDKTFRPKDFNEFWLNDCFRTHYRNAKIDMTGRGKKPGSTFYLGNLKKRDKILRIYDKDIQSNGLIDAVRYEFELHSKYAQNMQLFLIDNRLQFGTYIGEWFDIVKPIYDESNFSKCPLNERWEVFINKHIFCEQLQDIFVPTLTEPVYKMSRKTFVEKYLVSVLKDYVCLYGMDELYCHLQNAPNSPRYDAEQVSLKMRSVFDNSAHMLVMKKQADIMKPRIGFEYFDMNDCPFNS